MSLRVAGLDLSLNHTGIAYPGGSTEVLEPTNLKGVARHAKVRSQVLERVRGADIVVSEAPYIARMHPTTVDLVGLHAVVNAALWSNRIAMAYIAPSTLKKYATGNGGKDTDKAAMRAALVEHLGPLAPTDDNEVDAFWLRAAGLEHYGDRLFVAPAPEALNAAVWPHLEDILAAAL